MARRLTLGGAAKKLARYAYLILIQSAVGVAALALLVYLTLNSPSAAGLLGGVLTEVLPGTLSVTALQWGPSPGRIRLGGVRIAAPSGRPVIHLARGDIQLDWLKLVDALVRGKSEIPLRFERVRLDEPEVFIEADPWGRLLLPMAFSDPDAPPSPEPGPRLHLDVAQVRITGGRYRMNLPGIALRAAGIKVRGAVQVHVPAFGSPDVAWQAEDVAATEVDVAPAAIARLPHIPTGAVQVRAAHGDLTEVQIRRADVQIPAMPHWFSANLPDTSVAGLDLAIALTPDVQVTARDADIATSTASAFLGQLLGPRFDCMAVAQGGFRLDPVSGFVATAHAAGRGKIAGFASEHVEADVEVHASLPGQAAVTVDGRDVWIAAYGGEIRSQHVRYRMRTAATPVCLGADNDACEQPEPPAEPTHAVDGRFVLTNVVPAPLLQSEAVALDNPLAAQLTSRVDGEVAADVQVRLLPDTGCAVPLALDVALLAHLTMQQPLAPPAASRAAGAMVGERATSDEENVAAVHLRGQLGYRADSQCAQQIRLSHALIYDRGGPYASTAEIEHKDGDWLRADGFVRLGDDESDLHVAANVGSLHRLLAPLGIGGVTGALRIFDTSVSGGTVSPGFSGQISASNLGYRGTLGHRNLDLSLERLTAQVELRRGTLGLRHLEAQGRIPGTLSGDLSLDLFRPDKRRHLQLDRLTVKNLALGRLLALLDANPAGLDGAVSLSETSLRVDLAQPRTTLDLHSEVLIRDFAVAGEFFPQVRASLRATAGRIHAAPLGVRLQTQEWAMATVDTDLGFGHFDIHLSLPQTPLLALSRTLAKLPLTGSLGGDVHLFGTPERFALHGAVAVIGLGWDKIQLHDAQLRLDKEPTGPAVLSSPQFFPGFRLLAGSEIHVAGLRPTDVDLHIDTIDSLSVFGVLGTPAPPGMQAHIAADATAHVDLRPGQPLYTVRAEIAPRGLALDFGTTAQGLTNTSPAMVTLTPGKIALDSVYFDLGREPLELCGVLSLAGEGRAPGLLAFLAGTIDVPRIGALNDSLAAMDLELDILPWSGGPEDERAKCLESAQAGRGYLRLEGTTEAWAMQGRLRTRAGQITPRHFGHDVLVDEGGEFAIQPARDERGALIPGRMDVAIPANPDFRLSGTIDDGQFDAFGKVTLQQLAPHAVDFALNGTSIPVAVPKEYGILLSPQLRFVGTGLDHPARRSMLLSGVVDVPDGAYYRNFDRISGVVGGVAQRQVDQFSKPITETMPWLNEVGLDLRVNAQNIDVTSRIPFARVDAVVETEGLKVTGTLPAMTIVGRARVAPASDSKITYAINRLVFDVDHLWLDFQGDATRPYIDADIRAPINVRGSSTSSATSAIGAELNSESQLTSDVITVSVGYSGVLTADAKAEDLRFSDSKGDSPADVQCLILTNRKCSDSSAGGSSAPPISSAALLGNLGPSLLRPFQKLLGIDSVFDQFTFDFDASGSVGASGSKKLGNQISFATRVQTGVNGNNLYNVSFNFRATDRLSAGGLWRRTPPSSQAASSTAAPTEAYEFKIKYKQPLE